MRYRRPLLDYAQRILGSPELAEDALQLAFLQAWSALQRQHEVASVRPWLYRIVHNAALRVRASNQHDQAELDDDLVASHGADAQIERRIALRSTLESIAALPVRQREALVLTAISGSSHDEAAAAMGLSAGAVRGLVHRARTSLRAAAAAVMPLPGVGWLLHARHRPSTPGGLEAAAGGAGVAGGVAKVGAVVLTTTAVLAAGVTVRHHLWLGPGQRHPPRLAATAHRSASGIRHLRFLKPSSSGSGGAGQAPRRGSGSPSGTRDTHRGDVTRATSVNWTTSTAGSRTDGSGTAGNAGTGGGTAGAGGGPGPAARGGSATSAGGPPTAFASVATANPSSSTTTSASSTTSTSDSNTPPSSTTDGSSGGTTSSTSQSATSSDTTSGNTSQLSTPSDGTASAVDSTGTSTSLNQATDSTAQPSTD